MTRTVTRTVEVVDGLAAQWPTLAQHGPLFATPGWLRAMDGRLGEHTMTIVVRRDGQATLAAYASVQEHHRPGELFDLHHALVHPGDELPLTPRSRTLRAELAAAAPPPQRWLPSLVVMLPGYECTPVGADATDAAATAALTDGALRWAASHGIATVAMLYLRPEATTLAAALAGRGFTRLPLAPTWDLHLPGATLDGATLDGYLASLPRKRRHEARRELRLLDEAGVTIAPVAATMVFDDLVRLRCQLVARYRGAGVDPGQERSKLRRIIDYVAGGRPHVLLATAGGAGGAGGGGAGGAPLGFALFAEHRDMWHCLAVGADYTDPRSRLTYFATAYYRAAELAYTHGVRTLGYGLGAWQAKRARGCRPTPLDGWVYTTDAELAATLQTSARITELVGMA